jgi:hypothetical protein
MAPLAGAAWLLALATGAAPAAAARQAGTGAPSAPEAALLTTYCLGCHNERARIGDLALDTLDIADVGPHAETWEKVVRKVRTGMMPPSGARRPEPEALDAFAAALEARLDAAADQAASLATPALHRLNRTEYGNAIRDLLALDVDADVLLPPDGSSEGFDNIAEALAISPSLVQGYVSAAMKISRLAVGDRSLAPSQVTYAAPPGLAQDRHIDGLPLGTRGGMVVEHLFPLDAEYEFSLGGGGRGAGFGGGGLDVTIDGEPVDADNPRDFRMRVAAGPHRIGIALLDNRRSAGTDEIYSDFRVDGAFTLGGGIPSLVITGPYDAEGPGDTPARQRVFVCRPAAASDEDACAERILRRLARRAFRGPVDGDEIATLMAFYREGREAGDFETGIQRALARVLVAPRFVYRAETQPAGLAAGTVYPVSDVDLASRLSFFLWSSIPDDELLDVAVDGRLGDTGVLEAQVRRMLADPKAAALVENFAGQWLYLRELERVQTEAADFDENLRRSFRRETELVFDSIVREDRSLVELLDADYTFVDERLARHYGIPGVSGSHFRKVALAPDSPRRGLLGQGSMLTVTSVATRTSPVSRGKWVLENLLGTPAPVPPPGVETNLEPTEAGTATTLRERLEQHRASPTCASCHRIMYPMGFALENIDLIGAWREQDEGAPIDSTGQLADGTRIDGPADLRNAVLDREDAFMSTATSKLLTYALGRPVHYGDMPVVRSIVRRANADDNRFSALVMGVVQSDAFRMRVARGDDSGD